MKVLKLAVVFALVAGIFCGGQEQAETPGYGLTEPAKGTMPAVAFEDLTEAEMAKLTAALPDVVAALKAAGYSPEEREGDEIPDALARAVSGMGEVAGVQAALKKHKTDWNAFSNTMYKVMAASAAIGLDMAIQMAEAFVDDSEEGQEMKAELEKARAFCGQVPEANREMIIENMDKLEILGEIN